MIKLKTLIFLLCTFSTSVLAQVPTAPLLEIDTNAEELSITWAGSVGATGYRLYFAPYPEMSPIFMQDMGSSTEVSGNLNLGDSYYVAIEPYNNEGAGAVSNVEYFVLAEPNLRLYEKSSFSILGEDYSELSIPYFCTQSNCSKQSSATIVGGSSHTHEEYKLVAEGKSFTISSLSATNLTGGIAAWFDGLEVGQTIKPNEDVIFTTKTNLTGGASSVFQWTIGVEGEGTIFTDTITFSSN